MEGRVQYSPVRSYQRFKAMDRALVLINQGPESLPYHIVDISEGGLSFRYLGKKLKRSEITKISLYHDYKLVVDDLPINAISDYRLQNNLIPVRRGSIIFKELTDEQLSKLEVFIQSFTEAPLPVS
ncbi:MAG: PilZ domain-containing protein [Desulfuromusa sp.]|nr:PilZ domain-containing protein [Desulfuromusa sp.]